MSIKYCPTELTMADYMAKPLVGRKFKKFRDWILNLSPLLDSRSVLEDKENKNMLKDKNVKKLENEDMRKTAKCKRSHLKEITNNKNKIVRRDVSMKKPLTYLEAVKRTAFRHTSNGKILGPLNSKGLDNQLKRDIRAG